MRRIQPEFIFTFCLFVFQNVLSSLLPAASKRLPRAGWEPRTGTPNSAHPSGNSFHQNLSRVSSNTKPDTIVWSVVMLFKIYIKAQFKDRVLTYAGFEKLAAYSLVHTDCLGYLLHISSGGLAQSADAVDAADSLGQECIGCLHKHIEILIITSTKY